MRAFSTGVRLWDLALETKIVFSAYVLFSLLGLLTSALYSWELAGDRGLEGLSDYYAPTEAAAVDEGPKIEVAPQDDQPLIGGVTYRKLLEVSHFHFFMVPVLLLVISHLFVLAGLARRTTTAWLFATWGLALAHLLAPWLIHYGSARLTVLMPLTGAGMLATVAFLCLVTTYRMWRRPAAAG